MIKCSSQLGFRQVENASFSSVLALHASSSARLKLILFTYTNILKTMLITPLTDKNHIIKYLALHYQCFNNRSHIETAAMVQKPNS